MSSDKYVVMFVCTGNTCRSPMAHGILRHMAEVEGRNEIEVISSGTGTLDGYPATASSVEAALKDGIDISDHHSRVVSDDLVQASDLILTMAFNHYVMLVHKYPDSVDKIHMLKAFPDREPSDALSIEDPIGADFETYKQTYAEIKSELEHVWPAIKTRADEKLRKT